jgi:lipid II:glycine glycyltransferase (peptidoglycan interpeptide bridge formation enzyme)
MEISSCNNKLEWDRFIKENSNSFLQSFDWGDFQEKVGKKCIRLQLKKENEILVQVQIIKEKAFFSNYFYIPYGPVFAKDTSTDLRKIAMEAIFAEISKIHAKENCIFLRIEPLSKIDNLVADKVFAPYRRFQPQKTLALGLEQTEEELFRSFSRTTKYNIRLAQRKGVKIQKQKESLTDFYNLMSKTKDRQDFGIHSENYYKGILGLNGDFIKTELFFAEYEDKKINATLMVYFGDTAITLHAGSDYNFRQIKGANLLEWEIILDARKKGFKKIDFWGIDDKKWPGLTAFKKGFGGQEIDYPEGIDIAFNGFLYYFYKTIKIIKKAI